MFDLIFDAMQGWNQFGMFLMAFLFTAIGGFIVGYEVRWRMKGKLVRARIKALKVSGGSIKATNLEVNVDTDDTQKSALRRKLEERHAQRIEEDKENEAAGGKPLGVGGVIFIGLFALVPLIFVGFGIYSANKYYTLKSTGDFAQATVIRNDSSYDSDSGTTYKAVLRFVDSSGITREVKDNISYGNSPSYEVGTNIGVYYDPQNYKFFIIDDFWHYMAIGLAFGGFGGVFLLLFAAGVFFNNRKSEVKETEEKHSIMNEIYYPVYEFKNARGDLVEHSSKNGSNSFLSSVPGSYTRILIDPNNPEKVKLPSMAIIIFGLVFLLPGLFIGGLALQQELNYMTFVIPVIFLGYIGFKIMRFVRKIPKKEWNEGLADLKKNGITVTSSSGNYKSARLLEPHEVKIRIRKHTGYMRIWGVFLLLISAGLGTGSYFSGLSMIDMVRNGVKAKGEVVDIESRYSSSSDSSGYTYYAVVEFKDMSNATHRFRDSVGSSSSLYKRGDDVDVIYMPEDKSDAIIDRGLMNWGLSGGLAIACILMLLIAGKCFILVRKYGATKYRGRV